MSILPKSTRRRRAARRLSNPRDPLLDILIEREAMTADLVGVWVQRQEDLAIEKERKILEEEQRRIFRPLVLDFSHEESQSQAVSIIWEDNENYIPSSSLINYTLFKNRNPIAQKKNVSDLPIFIDQPDTNALTTYLITYKDQENHEGSSATVTVGAEKVTNLKATITAGNKILLNWNPLDQGAGLDWDPLTIKWAIFRNGEIIDIKGTANSFEDNQVEPNQVYIYRVIAFIQENEPWAHQRHAIFYSKPLIVSTEKAEDFEQDSFLFYTYLLSEPVTDLGDLSQNPNAYYTSIKDKEPSSAIVQKSIVSWEDNTPIEMLDGLIDVELNGRSLVSSACFDNVRMLWDYLLAMVEQYLQTDQATIYFPSQPIPISLKKKTSGVVEFQIDDQWVTIDEKKCLTAILQGAEQFFTLLNEVSIDKYSLLLEQMSSMQEQIKPTASIAPQTLQAKADRISLNRILLSWVPSNKDVKSYTILLDEKSIITLPAYKTSYTHIFQPKEQAGKCVYKIVAYDQTNKVVENCSVEIEIADSYLQVEKIAPLSFEISWAFQATDIPLIGFYEIFRNGVSLGLTNSTTYTEIAPVVGKYTYEIKALGISGQPLDIAAIIIEKTIPNQVQLNWIFPEPEENTLRIYEYRRYYNGSSSPSFISGTTIVHTPNAVGKYTYEIKALDFSETNSAMGPLTKEIEITQQDIPLDKQTVQAISQALVRRTSANEVLLSWTPNTAEDIKSYEVLIDDEPLIALSGSTQQYTHNIQQTGHLGKCVYKLIARDQNDREYEPYSLELEITPSYLQVEKTAGNIFELNWTFSEQDRDSIGFYKVYRNDTFIRQTLKDVTTFSDTTLLAPGTYIYRVEALDENGSTLEIEPAIKEVIVIKEEGPYLRVNTVNSKIMGLNVVDLSWKFLEQNGSSIESYNISRNNSLLRQVSKEETEFTDISQIASGEHIYRVEALDRDENILETKQVTVKIDE